MKKLLTAVTAFCLGTWFGYRLKKYLYVRTFLKTLKNIRNSHSEIGPWTKEEWGK